MRDKLKYFGKTNLMEQIGNRGFVLLGLVLLLGLFAFGMVFLWLIPTEKLLLIFLIVIVVGIFALLILGTSGVRRGAGTIVSPLIGGSGAVLIPMAVTAIGLGILSGTIAGMAVSSLHQEGWGVLKSFEVTYNGEKWGYSGIWIGKDLNTVLYFDNVPERGHACLIFELDNETVRPAYYWLDNREDLAVPILVTLSPAYGYTISLSADDIDLRSIEVHYSGEPIRITNVKLWWKT